MKRKIVSGIILTLLLIGMLILTFNIQLIKAEPSNMGELIIEVVYVSGDAIYPIYAQGRIIETGQEFQTDPWNLTSFELTVGNYTIEVTYENETKTKRAEILEGQTTYLLFEFGEYIGPPPIDPDPVGGIYIPVDKLSLLAPYITLVSTIILAVSISVAYIKIRKKQ